MNFKLERIIVIIGAIIIIALAIGLPFIFQPSDSLLPSFALSQLAFSAVAFFIVFLALYLTMVQLRKSMAKPKLEVIFSEILNHKTSISVPQNQDVKYILKLSVVNKGNAITKLFQIDFTLPTIFNPRLEPTTGLIPKEAYAGTATNPRQNPNMTSTISYYSNEQVYCFVNRPAPIHMLVIKTRSNEYDNYPNEFKIKYSIYGDWAETQKGELEVICYKDKEASHAST